MNRVGAGQRLIVVLFAVAMGHLLWRALGPVPQTDHFAGGEVTLLSAPTQDTNQLYLRRSLHCAERPRHAWLQVIARDRHDVYVNGVLVGSGAESGSNSTTVVDLAPYLDQGENSIAVRAETTTSGAPPLVSIDGGYSLSDGEHDLHDVHAGSRADVQLRDSRALKPPARWRGGTAQGELAGGGAWRCATAAPRKAAYWFARGYDDHDWPTARATTGRMIAPVELPLRAITAPRMGRWMTAESTPAGEVVFRRDFRVSGRPRSGWLRLTAISSHRLSVNGVIIDREDAAPEGIKPAAFAQRTYDLTEFLRGGQNTIAIAMSVDQPAVQVLADVEVVDRTGSSHDYSSGAEWLTANGQLADWYRRHVDPSQWTPARAESGDMGVPPWGPARSTVLVTPPAPRALLRFLAQAAITLLAAAIALILLHRAPTWLVACRWYAKEQEARRIMALSLLAVCAIVAALILVQFDPRVGRQHLFSVWVAVGCAAVIPLSCWAARERAHYPQPAVNQPRSSRTAWRSFAVFALILVAFVLRARGINDPLSADEMSVFRATRGFIERGFPSVVVHEDVPTAWIATSELVYVPTAIAGLLFDDPNWVVRLPSVLFGTATAFLILWVGRRMFASSVGWLAAILYAVSPTCVQMSNFGRYFSQLQFLTLLTAYLFYRLIRDPGPLNPRLLWGTTLCFVATFLSWEASALLAPGMIVALVAIRRARVSAIVMNRAVWLAILVVGAVVVLQNGHRTLQQAQRLVYGTGASEVAITLMTRYPGFDPLYYVWESSWVRDAALPMLGLLAAVVVATRHGFSRPARFLLILLFTTALLQSLLLPLRAWRYAYHLTPFTILLASAGVAALTRAIRAIGVDRRLTERAARFAGRVGVAFALLFIALGCGLLVDLDELPSFRVSGAGLSDMKFPDMAGTSRYLRDHLREGDVVLATGPHVANEFLAAPADYWPQSRLHLQAVLDDHRPVPLHRLAGTVMIPTMAELDAIFAKHDRVWFLSVPSFDAKLNSPETIAYLRDHMDLVREDFSSQLLLRDRNHRSATMRRYDRAELVKAKIATPASEWW